MIEWVSTVGCVRTYIPDNVCCIAVGIVGVYVGSDGIVRALIGVETD